MQQAAPEVVHTVRSPTKHATASEPALLLAQPVGSAPTWRIRPCAVQAYTSEVGWLPSKMASSL